MKILSPASGILLILFLVSCKAMNKTSVHETSIPSDIGNKTYKILFVELNFENTVSDNVAKIHNNSAEKYVKKQFKGVGEFIDRTALNNSKYADTKIYRYVLMNTISKKLNKTYTYDNSSRSKETITSYISGFYFVDRDTGKEYPYAGESTTALWMFKAIIDKVNGYF